MDLNLSLILLVILIAPPLFLAGKELLNHLFFDEADALFGRRGEVKDARDRFSDTQGDNAAAYDGMITVEIPAHENEAIAHQPLPDTVVRGDNEIVTEDAASRASRA